MLSTQRPPPLNLSPSHPLMRMADSLTPQYQDQMRLQQQHQHQQQQQQRLVQAQAQAQAQLQAAQAQAMQVQNGAMLPPQQPHPVSTPITAPSPQQQGAQLQHGSPMNNIPNTGRSPASGQSRANGTPSMGNTGLPNPVTMPSVKTLIDNFPKLLELKRHGKLLPEQEKLVSGRD